MHSYARGVDIIVSSVWFKSWKNKGSFSYPFPDCVGGGEGEEICEPFPRSRARRTHISSSKTILLARFSYTLLVVSILDMISNWGCFCSPEGVKHL